jgi:hypothetical protein
MWITVYILWIKVKIYIERVIYSHTLIYISIHSYISLCTTELPELANWLI